MEWQAAAVARTLNVFREDLLRDLRERFQSDLPADLVAAVNAQMEPAKLSAWLRGVAKAGTLDEARKVVGLP
jgi:hypothetical protein